LAASFSLVFFSAASEGISVCAEDPLEWRESLIEEEKNEKSFLALLSPPP
jgi:hypothetical protein